jgi:Predicted peptidase
MMRKIYFIFLVLCFGWCLTIGICNGEGTSVIPDITNQKWYIHGPFANPQNQWLGHQGFQYDYLTEYGGEAKASLVSQWPQYRMEKGVINFVRIFGPIENQVAYAYCEFTSARSQTVALKLGSDDGIKVWLNGQLVFSHHIHRSLLADEDAVAVQLKPGINRLMCKIEQGNGAWGFTARLCSIDEDISNWNRQRNKRYQICLVTNFTADNHLSLSVLTQPSYAVKDEVNLKVRDQQGNMILQKTVVTGEAITLTLPPKSAGVYQLETSSYRLNLDNTTEKVLVAIGNPKQIVQTIVNRARRDANLPVEPKNGEDFSATLTFLADQLEGKIHDSLVTPERNLRALTIINEICQKAEDANHNKKPWPNASLRGIRQWAYRSTIDGSIQPYTVYLPEDYNPAKRYKLVVCLHGYSGDDYGAVQTILTGAKPDDFIVVAPFGRGDMAYTAVGEQDVLDVMDLIRRNYSIDPDCIYLTGWSMGGCGTWRIGQFYADRFAAIAPFCGWTSTSYLENLQNLPTLVVHGAVDQTVPVEYDQNSVARLSELKAPVIYEELPGVDHDAWGGWLRKHGGNNLFDYFRNYRRICWPERVEMSIPYLRFRKHYWVRIEEFGDPRKPGYINAQVIDARHLDVETENISAFTLDLNHPKLAKNGRVLLDINGYSITADTGKEATFSAEKDGDPFIRENNNLPKTVVSNDDGGLADLFNRPLYIVYGTANHRRTHLLRREAEILADWMVNPAVRSGVKSGHYRIKADTALTLRDQKQNDLLLLGTDTENRIVAKLMAKKEYWSFWMTGGKIRLGDEKYFKSGLIMVYPNPDNRKQLVGFLALPYSNDILINFVAKLKSAMTQYALNDGVGSFTTPGFMIYGQQGKLIQSGYFDRHWKIKK